MRLLSFIIFFFSTTFFVDAQQIDFTFKGRINKDSKAEKLYLQGASTHVEISITANREFFYTGKLAQSELCFMYTDKSYSLPFWVAAGDTEVNLREVNMQGSDSLSKALLDLVTLKGPEETEKFKWFNEQQPIISNKFLDVTTANHRDSMAKYFDPLLEEYILAHPQSKLSVHLTNLASNKKSARKLIYLVDREVGGEMRAQIENDIKQDSLTQKGLTVEDFEMKTIKGLSFSSKQLSSKYTLLEFWAHNCYPCRQENPALVEVYNDFHKKGFEIVGIGVESSKEHWQKAVEEDKLPWIHVSDLKEWDNILVKRYFVDAIPFNILMDENKKIVTTNLSPNALKNTLEGLLNN